MVATFSLSRPQLSILTLVLVPLLTAALGFVAGNRSVNKDYVEIAVGVLNDEKSPKDLRVWAVSLLDDLAPVSFSEKAKEGLVAGASLGRLRVNSSDIYNLCPPIPPLPKSNVDPQRAVWESQLIALYGECASRHRHLIEVATTFVAPGKLR